MHKTKSLTVIALSSPGVDIGKGVFHVVGFDLEHEVVLRRKINRLGLERALEKLPRCIVGLALSDQIQLRLAAMPLASA